jgi:hypothetical protein
LFARLLAGKNKVLERKLGGKIERKRKKKEVERERIFFSSFLAVIPERAPVREETKNGLK